MSNYNSLLRLVFSVLHSFAKMVNKDYDVILKTRIVINYWIQKVGKSYKFHSVYYSDNVILLYMYIIKMTQTKLRVETLDFKSILGDTLCVSQVY